MSAQYIKTISGWLYGHGLRKRTARQTPEDVHIRAGTIATLAPQPLPIFCANDVKKWIFTLTTTLPR